MIKDRDVRRFLADEMYTRMGEIRRLMKVLREGKNDLALMDAHKALEDAEYRLSIVKENEHE